jgi:ISXO2-like transposase domain
MAAAAAAAPRGRGRPRAAQKIAELPPVDHPMPPTPYQIDYKVTPKINYNVREAFLFEELRVMNYECIFRDSDFCWQFAAQFGLIRKQTDEFECPRAEDGCTGIMRSNWDPSKSLKIPYKFKCSKCRKTSSAAKKTWFDNSKIEIRFSLLLPLLHIMKVPVTEAAGMNYANCGVETAVCYYYLTRETAGVIITNAYRGPRRMIGGAGRRVQMDESHIFVAKHNRGERTANEKRHLWVFGMWEEGTDIGLFFLLHNRNKGTLWPIIARYVDPASILISDGWKGYLGLARHFRQHQVVNHSQTFKDPISQANTNSIEGRWKGLKLFIKSCRSEEMLMSYLFWYMYNVKYMKPLADRKVDGQIVGGPGLRFRRFLKHLKRVYPGEGAARDPLEMEAWPEFDGDCPYDYTIPVTNAEVLLLRENNRYIVPANVIEGEIYDNFLAGLDDDDSNWEDDSMDPDYIVNIHPIA